MSEATLVIGVDAMGGDYAPEAIIEGAIAAVTEGGGEFQVRLFGDEARIQTLLGDPASTKDISIVHAPDTIGMHESATAAVKTKRDASVVRMLESHRDGEVHGCVGAGNTGAMMAAATLILGRIAGIARPTIGTFFPSERGRVLVVDAGANVDSTPRHLVQFGVMGAVFVGMMLGIERPAVGLLSVGEEESKGNEAVVEAHRLMKNAPFRFVGNVEGRDILKGKADVVVCDGFIGNILLKFAESVPLFLKTKLRHAAGKGLWNRLAVGLASGTLRNIMREWDYQEHGGVPLLGVNGVAIIGHGRSTPKAVRNMIFKAREMIDRRVSEHIAASVRSFQTAAET
ncbi:MAG: phosphate acyltransferase PlsX [Bacteroidota bacterium]|nr:phosphate acyltransferase PlsX [Bacteroidota bacterium]